MRNEYGVVIDCMELFPSLEDFYDTMMDLLSDPDAVRRLSKWVSVIRLDLQAGFDMAFFNLFTDGVEFSVTVVGKDYREQPKGTVRVYAYEILPVGSYA